jgi:hypothetical protein
VSTTETTPDPGPESFSFANAYEQEPEWPVLYIELPGAGQVSWHMPQHSKAWDGHDHAVKRDRVRAYCMA